MDHILRATGTSMADFMILHPWTPDTMNDSWLHPWTLHRVYRGRGKNSWSANDLLVSKQQHESWWHTLRLLCPYLDPAQRQSQRFKAAGTCKIAYEKTYWKSTNPLKTTTWIILTYFLHIVSGLYFWLIVSWSWSSSKAKSKQQAHANEKDQCIENWFDKRTT